MRGFQQIQGAHAPVTSPHTRDHATSWLGLGRIAAVAHLTNPEPNTDVALHLLRHVDWYSRTVALTMKAEDAATTIVENTTIANRLKEMERFHRKPIRRF